MPAPVTINTFSNLAPPWSLVSLDANFAAIKAALGSTNTFGNYLVDTGSANVYVVSLPVGITATLTAGLAIQFLAATTNTGASTLNAYALGAVNITNWDGSALSAGQIKAGSVVSVVYDGTQYKLVGLAAGATVPLSSGSITLSAPALPITQTWNNGAVTFDTITVTITDSASAAASRFLNFLVGATTKFSVDKSGNVSIKGTIDLGIRSRHTSSDRISVTGATNIYSISTAGSSVGASAAMVMVNGYDAATPANSFAELVMHVSGVAPSAPILVVNRGTPAARTYTNGGNTLLLAMASGTYNVSVNAMEQAN
jgi:hypothetical protein